MTLIIAFILMGIVNAHWMWYPVVFVVWIIHVLMGYMTITENRPRRYRF